MFKKLLKCIGLFFVVMLIIVYVSNTRSVSFPASRFTSVTPSSFAQPSSSAQTPSPELLDALGADLEEHYPGRSSVDCSGNLISARLSVSPEDFSSYRESYAADGDVTDWFTFSGDVGDLLQDWRHRLDEAGLPHVALTMTIYSPSSEKNNTLLARYVNDSFTFDYFDSSAPAASVSSSSASSLGEQNALRSAQSYLKVSSFSKLGLLEQLQFEGYTYEEALFAVNACGADWAEQAYKSALAYLRISSFSRSGLIEQLEFEGFSHEEALYGVTKAGY